MWLRGPPVQFRSGKTGISGLSISTRTRQKESTTWSAVVDQAKLGRSLFPVVSLLYYAEIADSATQKQVFETVRKSLEFELAIIAEVNNPFGYSREYVRTRPALAGRASFSRTTAMRLRGGRERMHDWLRLRPQHIWRSRFSRMTRSFVGSWMRLLRIS